MRRRHDSWKDADTGGPARGERPLAGDREEPDAPASNMRTRSRSLSLIRSSSAILFRRVRSSSWGEELYVEDGVEVVDDSESYMPALVRKGSVYAGEVKVDEGDEPPGALR